jgi:hypothetical protein
METSNVCKFVGPSSTLAYNFVGPKFCGAIDPTKRISESTVITVPLINDHPPLPLPLSENLAYNFVGFWDFRRKGRFDLFWKLFVFILEPHKIVFFSNNTATQAKCRRNYTDNISFLSSRYNNSCDYTRVVFSENLWDICSNYVAEYTRSDDGLATDVIFYLRFTKFCTLPTPSSTPTSPTHAPLRTAKEI